MRRIQRTSPAKLPDETICLSLSPPYWNSKAFVGLPSPYMLLVRYFEQHDPESGKWFFAMKLDGSYLIFMKRLPNISDFYSAFPNRSTTVKTFNIRERDFRGYDLRYELSSYVELCRKLGITEIEEARSLIRLNSDTSIDRTQPIYYEQRDGRAVKPSRCQYRWWQKPKTAPEKPRPPRLSLCNARLNLLTLIQIRSHSQH